MVYHGKPSQSCFSCRSRRIKCDKDKTGCSQCKRMRMDCPGYPDPLDQTFRNENVKVRRKAQQTYTKNAYRDETPRERLSSNELPPTKGERATCDAFGSHDAVARSPESNPALPLAHVALAHFMTSYVPGSRFAYLPSMYADSENQGSLAAAVDAASIGRLAWELGEPSLMGAARVSYAKALTKTNLALSNPDVAKQDSTLVSVLMLSLFETMIWAGSGAPDNWNAHIQGALGLIRARGKSQLGTAIGRMLFTHVANMISVTNLRLQQRIPQDIIDLQTETLQHEDEYRPLYLITYYTSDMTNFIIDALEGDMPINKIIDSTLRMDAKYATFLEAIPPDWGYRSIILEEDDPDVYGRLVHEYPRPRMALIWNSIRMTRIFLNSIISRHAAMVSTPAAAPIQAQAQSNVELMAAEICATVLSFLGPKSFNVASAATLLWPLSEVKDERLVPQDMRKYADQTLKRLARRLRIPVSSSEGFSAFYLT